LSSNKCSNSEKNEPQANRDVRQIKYFYTADNKVVWITFYGRKMFWCFSDPNVELDRDSISKVRKVIGKWNCKTLKGELLSEDKLSGTLTATKGFRDTICMVKEHDYVVNKINDRISLEIEAVRKAEQDFVEKLTKIIKRLHWKDFEVLVDLIFRQAGWKRISRLGGTEKTIDLELLIPIKDEKVAAQVKSAASIGDYEKYQTRIREFGYSECYFDVHSPDKGLATLEPSRIDPKLKLIRSAGSCKIGGRIWLVAVGSRQRLIRKTIDCA
jgi:hypothetical protein